MRKGKNLKRLFSGFTIFIILLMSILASISSSRVNAQHSSENLYAIEKERRTKISFQFPQVVKMGCYDLLTMDNCSFVTNPGQPMLPLRTVVLKFPEESSIIDISVEVEETIVDGSFYVLPAPSPSIVGSQMSGNYSEDSSIYAAKSLFPKEWYTLREAHGLDAETNMRVKYLIINVFPLRFLPAERRLTRAESVDVKVKYVEGAALAPQVGLKNLIITSPALETYAIQLAQWKNDTGISSKVANTTWIYHQYGGIDRPEQIRTCIKDFVGTYGITYVTIFGDADEVPVRYAYVPDGEDTYTATDLYYADLDGTWDDNNDGLYADQRYDTVDGIPDVYVGRIPPSLDTYAQAAVDKIKGYQQQFNASESWTRRVVLAAGTGSGDGFSNPFGTAFPYLKNYTAAICSNNDFVKLYESYGNLSTASMSSEINQGALFANFAGHGNPGMWLFYWIVPLLGWYNGYGISDVQALTNGYKLPVVTTQSCSTAEFDDTDCIGEWFVLEPDGGSIAYFGSTRIAWGYADQWITTGLMGEIDWRIYANYGEGHTRLGQMWGETVNEYVQNHIWDYGAVSAQDVKTFMEFELLGDPTLRIYNPDYPELKVPEDCATIQGAINEAYEGDTILVSPGTYYENLVVNKTVSLIGKNAATTVLNGGGANVVISINANNSCINCFTLQGSGTGNGVLLTGGSNVTLRKLQISKFGTGVLLNSSGCVISENNITLNRDYGIRGYNWASNNTITQNRIMNNGGGIYFMDEDMQNFFYNNVVTRNLVSNNTNTGILFYGAYSCGWSPYNIISENTITNNTLGIQMMWGEYNTVSGNQITAIEDGLILVANDYSTISENRITTINGSGISLRGDWAYHWPSLPSHNTISGNKIAAENGSDVAISGGSYNTVSGNNITATNGSCIYLYPYRNYDYGTYVDCPSTYNHVSENNLTGADQNSIRVVNSSSNSIYHNNIYTQNAGQVYSENSENLWDDGYPSGGNYWSDHVDIDLYRGPNQDVLGGDSIWDHPYQLGENNQDHYPLVNPWSLQSESYLAVRGAHNEIYYRTYNFTSKSWENWRVIPEGATCDSPAAAMYSGRLYFVVRGMDYGSLWFGSVNLTDYSFSSWKRLSGASPSAPTLVCYGSKLVLVVRGFTNIIYYRYYDTVSEIWGDWIPIPDGATCDSPAAVLIGNTLQIVARGVNDDQIWHSYVNLTDSTFSGWTLLSGATPSAPTLTTNGTSLCLVVRGETNLIWYRFYDLASKIWGDWTALSDGATIDGPAATFTNNQIQVIVRGMSDDQIWHGYVNLADSTFSGWTLLDGATPSAPKYAD